jgi:DNA-binding XRE family transcriptional regulator
MVRYVGVTKDVYFRLHRHVRDNSRLDSKRAWINELEQLGLSPELEVLETIEIDPDRPEDIDVIALQREKYWIQEFLKLGAHLLNVQSVPRQASSQTSGAKPTLFEEARLSAKLTVKQLAREARVSESLIYSIEHDKPVKVELAVRACRVLGIHLGQSVTYDSLNVRVTGIRKD